MPNDNASTTEDPTAADESPDAAPDKPTDRLEAVAAVVLALAVVFIAWAAFQAGKWSGEQSIKFSEAGAARTESTRFDT